MHMNSDAVQHGEPQRGCSYATPASTIKSTGNGPSPAVLTYDGFESEMDIQAEVSIPSDQQPEADFDPYDEFMFLIEPQPDPSNAMPAVNPQGAENEFDIDQENIPPADYMQAEEPEHHPPAEPCTEFDRIDFLELEKFLDNLIDSPCFTL